MLGLIAISKRVITDKAYRSLLKDSYFKTCLVSLHARSEADVSFFMSRGKSGVGYQLSHECLDSFKVGFYLKAVFPSRNLGLMRISRSRFKQSKNCSFISRIYVLRSFGNFWVIFRDIWEEIVFLNGLVKFREIRNGEDLM